MALWVPVKNCSASPSRDPPGEARCARVYSALRIHGPPSPKPRDFVFAARTLNAKAQSWATLSLREGHLRAAACSLRQEGKGPDIRCPKTILRAGRGARKRGGTGAVRSCAAAGAGAGAWHRAARALVAATVLAPSQGLPPLEPRKRRRAERRRLARARDGTYGRRAR